MWFLNFYVEFTLNIYMPNPNKNSEPITD